MKTLPGLTKCGLFVIAAFCLTASDCDRERNVLFLPNYNKADMIILPGTEITSEDAAQLRKTLKASSEYFYSIQPYENGVAGPVFGKLPVPTDFKCRTDKGEFGGFTSGISRGAGFEPFSRWTRIIGQGCQTRQCIPQGRRGRRGRGRRDGSQDLVNAVKPILQKYQAQ